MKKASLITLALILCWSLSVAAATPAQMAKHLPDQVGEYKALGPVVDKPMPFKAFVAIERKYKAKGEPLEVVLFSIAPKNNISYKVADDVDIKGLPGRLKILKDKKLVGLLVDLKQNKDEGKGKIVVSISQKGTTDPATVLDFAKKFEYQGLIKLQQP